MQRKFGSRTASIKDSLQVNRLETVTGITNSEGDRPKFRHIVNKVAPKYFPNLSSESMIFTHR